MSIRLSVFLTVIVVLTLASFAGAQATRTWVSGVGDDSNPCSRTAPCKTFAGAISKTATGGEINCIDPGGFGAFTITKSITIDCGLNGLTGGSILAANTFGISVNAANVVVTVRNLSINGVSGGVSPGTNGINFVQGSALHLENVKVFGFATSCVNVNTATSVVLTVENSSFSECGPNGMNLVTSSGLVQADLHNVKMWNSGASANGITAGNNTRLLLKDSDVSFANVGLNQLSGSSALVSNSNLSFNGTAVQGTSGSIATVSKSTFTLNGLVFGAGNIFSSGDNAGTLNTLNGSPAAASLI